MVRWLVIVGVALMGLVAVVAIIGAALPKEHRVTSSIVLRQPPDTVWMVIRDIGSSADWWKDVMSVARVDEPDQRERWRQETKMGAVPLVVTEDDPPHRLVTEIDVPPTASFGGTWTYEITSVDGGSRVRITEAGFINNVFFRFMAHTVFSMHATMDSYLKALGHRFEEEVTPRHET